MRNLYATEQRMTVSMSSSRCTLIIQTRKRSQFSLQIYILKKHTIGKTEQKQI